MIDVVVLGAGAAGLHCAAFAAATGKRVVILEHNTLPGKKIRISGGGRSNFTNREVTHHNMISRNPEFARSALSRYTPQDFLNLVDRYGIQWHEKKLGQLFCDESAQQIIDMLVQECVAFGVEIHYGVDIQRVNKSDHFVVTTREGDLEALNVVVATGGLSIPTLGASNLGYRIATQYGLPLVPTAPALVPLTFDKSYGERWKGLSGISVDAVVSANNISFRENILFTHRGLSGPAILQISSYLDERETFTVDLLPDDTLESLVHDLPSEKRHLSTILSQRLAQRVLEHWEDPILDKPVNSVQKKQLELSIHALKNWSLTAHGNEGYAKAEVTKGGVDTACLSSKTMECRNVPGLFFIGEVVDITGWLGGYNFQWAWSSAYAAGTAIAER
ncbi:MAG: NAD(P)/FAD-dependent oxidoreductase [Candidatus Kapabacteria bacterium]|nr:NAD(P)/FAD-dependent oxidoreductase [Candidatus Kapabacteria bacterium]